MISLSGLVVVEGKYDKIKLKNFIDAEIVVTNGFGIFKNREMTDYIRRAAEKRGIIIMTDSDHAGFMIRDRLCGCIDKKYITNVFVPEIKGKEKRKQKPSAEGYLGVEGLGEDMIREALRKAGITGEKPKTGEKITKTDLYLLGLSGREGSAEKRSALLKKLGLPSGMSPSQFITALNVLYDKEEFIKLSGEDLS